MSYSGPLAVASPANTTAAGTVQLAGDLAGTSAAPTVARINGVTLPSTAPTASQVLTATSATATTWQTPATGSGSTNKRVVTDTYSASLTPNSATTDIYRVILSGNPTINTPSGSPTDGQQLQIHLIQDGTGSRTVTWGSGYLFSTDIPTPTLTTTAGATDVHGFQYSATKGKFLLLGLVRGF